MTWKAHMDYVMVPAPSWWRLDCCSGPCQRSTKEASILVYNTILSLFDYCAIAWSSLLQHDQDRLQCLQNRSAWIITCCAGSSDAMEYLFWSTLLNRHSYHYKAKLVFLCLHSLVPSYFISYFTRFFNIHNYTLQGRA